MEMNKEGEMNHGDKMHEWKMEGHKHGHHRPWQSNWKSPVALGTFFLTTALAIAVVLYTILNVVGAVLAAAHPADQGMSAQDMQQLEQQIPAQGAPSGSDASLGQ
jgi:hypothetical protein